MGQGVGRGADPRFLPGDHCERVAMEDDFLELGPMILRLSQKLNAKIKAGKLLEMPLDDNPLADWSCHVFTAYRTQYILLTNTASLYSCVMPGRGISSGSSFIAAVTASLRDFMADDGLQLIFRKFVAPPATGVDFAKALNRSVIGSMNDHVHAATFLLAEGLAPSEIGYRLNETPMSALRGPDGRKYGIPRWTLVDLAERMSDE